MNQMQFNGVCVSLLVLLNRSKLNIQMRINRGLHFFAQYNQLAVVNARQ